MTIMPWNMTKHLSMRKTMVAHEIDWHTFWNVIALLLYTWSIIFNGMQLCINLSLYGENCTLSTRHTHTYSSTYQCVNGWVGWLGSLSQWLNSNLIILWYFWLQSHCSVLLLFSHFEIGSNQRYTANEW